MKNNSSSYSRKIVQYSGQHQQPDPTHNPFEWAESEVVWPSSSWDSYHDPIQIHEQPQESTLNFSFAISETTTNMIEKKLEMDMDLALSTISSARAIPSMHLQHSPLSPGFGSGSDPERAQQMSAPINVPVCPGSNRAVINRGLVYDDSEDDDGNCESGKNKMVPPHEIVTKSHVKMAFSVFEGAGRTLKGRDMRCVRNAVFRKTGFLD